MNCNTTHYRANSSSVPGDPTLTALAQPLVGDFLAKHAAEAQPVKFAAMEGHFDTERGAPIRLGGLPDVETATTPYALELPYGMSLLAFNDPHAEVKGLKEFPREDWPPVAKVHFAFQAMVGAGSAMALLALVTLVLRWRRREWPSGPRMMRAWLLASPLGVLAMEAGWLVTEWGRQPWIIRGVMRTADAVTPVPHLAAPFWTFTLVYLFLGVTVAFLLARQVAGTMPGQEAGDDH